MTQCRKLPAYASAIHLMGKKLLQEFADVIAARGKQQALAFLQKLRELQNVGGVGADGKWRKPLFDSEVIEKARKHARVGAGSHGEEFEYARYRTLEKVMRKVPGKERGKQRLYNGLVRPSLP